MPLKLGGISASSNDRLGAWPAWPVLVFESLLAPHSPLLVRVTRVLIAVTKQTRKGACVAGAADLQHD